MSYGLRVRERTVLDCRLTIWWRNNLQSKRLRPSANRRRATHRHLTPRKCRLKKRHPSLSARIIRPRIRTTLAMSDSATRGSLLYNGVMHPERRLHPIHDKLPRHAAEVPESRRVWRSCPRRITADCHHHHQALRDLFIWAGDVRTWRLCRNITILSTYYCEMSMISTRGVRFGGHSEMAEELIDGNHRLPS